MIDEEKLIAIIRKELDKEGDGDAYDAGFDAACISILRQIHSPQQEQPEDNEEKSWSLQIQAYLTTASDELYAPGKPLYTKEHHEGIHECMKMWQKLHQYYFSARQEQPELPGIEEPGIPGKDFIPVEWVDACEMYGKWKIVKQEQPEVELEEEINKFFENVGMPVYWCNDAEQREFCSNLARHFWNKGYNARKEE